MKRRIFPSLVLALANFLFAFVLASCLETVDPNEENCIDTNQIVSVGILSKERVKEVVAYAGDDILCESMRGLFFKKNGDEQLYRYSYGDTTMDSEQDDWFFSIGCYIRYDKDVGDKRVVFQITDDDGIKVLDMDGFLIGKTSVTVVSDRDTAWLFSYSGSMLNDGSQEFNFSVSTRMGCRDGYCFVLLPIWEDVFCFDKNNKNMKYLFEGS